MTHMYLKSNKIRFHQALPITQTSNNVFVSDGPSFLFLRDNKVIITGFSLSLGRTRDVWFQKQSIGSN